MTATEVIDEAGCRIDCQRGAADDQSICICDGVNALADHILIQSFFIEHHIRLDYAAALAAWNPL